MAYPRIQASSSPCLSASSQFKRVPLVFFRNSSRCSSRKGASSTAIAIRCRTCWARRAKAVAFQNAGSPQSMETVLQQQSNTAPSKEKLKVSWAGAGVFFFWQLGAMKYLAEHYDLTKVPMVGASGGSLASVLAACGVDADRVIQLAFQMSEEYKVWERALGLLGIWGSLIEKWLDVLLPENAHELCRDRITVVVTTLPDMAQVGISDFKDKKDLINSCMASSHVPFVLDYKLTRTCRGRQCVDGSFPDFFTGLNSELLRKPSGGTAVIFDYFDDIMLKRKGRMDMLEVKSYDEILRMYATGYEYAAKLHRDGRFDHYELAEVLLQGEGGGMQEVLVPGHSGAGQPNLAVQAEMAVKAVQGEPGGQAGIGSTVWEQQGRGGMEGQSNAQRRLEQLQHQETEEWQQQQQQQEVLAYRTAACESDSVSSLSNEGVEEKKLMESKEGQQAEGAPPSSQTKKQRRAVERGLVLELHQDMDDMVASIASGSSLGSAGSLTSLTANLTSKSATSSIASVGSGVVSEGLVVEAAAADAAAAAVAAGGSGAVVAERGAEQGLGGRMERESSSSSSSSSSNGKNSSGYSSNVHVNSSSSSSSSSQLNGVGRSEEDFLHDAAERASVQLEADLAAMEKELAQRAGSDDEGTRGGGGGEVVEVAAPAKKSRWWGLQKLQKLVSAVVKK